MGGDGRRAEGTGWMDAKMMSGCRKDECSWGNCELMDELMDKNVSVLLTVLLLRNGKITMKNGCSYAT